MTAPSNWKSVLTPTFFLWGVFLAICLVLGFVKVRQNEQYRADETAQQMQAKEIQHVMRVTRDKINALLRSRSYPESWSRQDLEKELPGEPQLVLSPSSKTPGGTEVTWTHPATGARWWLEFDENEKLTGHGNSWGIGSGTNKIIILSGATFEDRGEQFRQFIVQRSWKLWFVLLLVWTLAGRYRYLVSQLLLAVALAGGLANLIAPNYTLPGLFSNDPLFFDAIMIAVSLASLAITSPQQRTFIETWLLPRRRYSLRWLFGVTTLIAVLVALRWYGLVIGSVLVVAVMFYVICSRFFHPAAVS